MSDRRLSATARKGDSRAARNADCPFLSAATARDNLRLAWLTEQGACLLFAGLLAKNLSRATDELTCEIGRSPEPLALHSPTLRWPPTRVGFPAEYILQPGGDLCLADDGDRPTYAHHM